MSTENATVKPLDGWKSVFTGPTETPLSIEKVSGSSVAYAAVSEGVPDLAFGHPLYEGPDGLRDVALKEGQSLYILCIDSLSPAAINQFAITS